MAESDLVVVDIFPNELLARVAASALEADGIKTFVAFDDAGGAYPFLQVTRGVRLIVNKADEERARSILEGGESRADNQ